MRLIVSIEHGGFGIVPHAGAAHFMNADPGR